MPNWWPFSKEPKVDPEILFQEAEAELRREFDRAQADGTPRQALLDKIERESRALEQQSDDPETKARLRAYDLLYSELRPRMLANLTNGKNHEMADQIDEAIDYYEKAVHDQVPTRFPYEHLRIIYRRREQYEEMQRICLAALDNPFLSEQDHAHFEKWGKRLQAAAADAS